MDAVIVLWTANTERFSDVVEGVNDTVENLKSAIANNHSEISPSTLFAYAAISNKASLIFNKTTESNVSVMYFRM